MLLTKRSCPGTSTNPKRTPFSSRKAEAQVNGDAAAPFFFQAVGMRAGQGFDQRRLPWSMCPAVPTMTLFDGRVMGI